MICNCETKEHTVSYQCCKAGTEECGFPHSKCEGVEKVAPEGADAPCTEEELTQAGCPVEGLFCALLLSSSVLSVSPILCAFYFLCSRLHSFCFCDQFSLISFFAPYYAEKFEWKASMICNCVTKAHIVSYKCCKAGTEECGFPHSKCEGAEKVAPEGADVPCTEEELVSAECPAEGLRVFVVVLLVPAFD
jgi:hypothetical protein